MQAHDRTGGCSQDSITRFTRLVLWTQADLAQRAGVSRQTINAIETGKFDPSLPLAFRLANLFNLKIEEIFLDDQ